MPRYRVEYRAWVFVSVEVEAEDELQAPDIAGEGLSLCDLAGNSVGVSRGRIVAGDIDFDEEPDVTEVDDAQP